MRFSLAMASIGAAMHAMLAWAGGDCAPLGHLPSHHATREIVDAVRQARFQCHQGRRNRPHRWVAGKTCTQDYSLNPGTADIPDLQVETSYRALLTKLGAQTVFADNNNTVAKIVKGSEETWISIYSLFADVHVIVLTKSAAVQVLTAPGTGDYRLVGHMPGYVVQSSEKRDPDKFLYKTQNAKDTKDVLAQGTGYRIVYKVQPGTDTQSNIAIQTNYRTALKALNAQILFTDDNTTTARLESNGQTIWIGIGNLFENISVTVIEEKPVAPPPPPARAGCDEGRTRQGGSPRPLREFRFQQGEPAPGLPQR